VISEIIIIIAFLTLGRCSQGKKKLLKSVNTVLAIDPDGSR